MVDKKFIVAAIGVVVALGAVGPSFAQMFQHAEAHGVQAQLQSRFVRIDDETWSKQSVQTGDTLTDSGKFVSLVDRDLRGWYTVYGDSPNAGNRWEVVARDPPGNVITIPANAVVPYKITIRALEPAVYHMHTQLNIASIGPGLGPGQTIVVTGPPIVKPIPYTNIIYQSIIIGAGYAVTFATRPWQVI
ncbi:MAG: ammonia monooxygenase [Thaumarchaeota archaeon]|nr:ammonia monooxygenase [Nitrososphaerota archaeon]